MNNSEEVKKWLNRAFYADKKANALKELVLQCRERAEGVSACLNSNDGGGSTSVKNSAEEAILRLLDMERKLEREISGQLRIVDEIYDVISRLDDGDLESVLIHRYILFHTVRETAEILNYDPRTVKRKQKQAIEKLVTKCPCLSLLECDTIEL